MVGKLEENLQERDVTLDELRLNRFKSQQHVQELENRKREVQFEMGDMVYLKLYHQKFVARRPFEKLAARFYGLFSDDPEGRQGLL